MGTMQVELQAMNGMTPEQRVAFEARMAGVRKNPSTAVILSIFGLGRFYLDEVGTGIAQWVLAFFFVGLIWMFVDIFTASSRTEDYNNKKATSIAQIIRTQYPSSSASQNLATVFCSSCGAGLEGNAAFCAKCGASQAKKKCPSCAEFIQPDAKKCRFCGEVLPVEA
jgi:TM2 domain-containing membrane protein YozV